MNHMRLLVSMTKQWYNNSIQYTQIRSRTCTPEPMVPVKGIVIGIYQKEGNDEPKLTRSGEKINDQTEGMLSKLICESKITGKLGRGKIFSNLHYEYTCIAVVGVGLEGIGFNELEMLDEGMENVRTAAGIGARSLQLLGVPDIWVDSMDYPEQAGEGANLATWHCQDLIKKERRTIKPRLAPYEIADTEAWMRGCFKAEAQNLARRLSDASANCMTPTMFAQEAVNELCPCGITVEVRTMDWIEQQRLNSMLMIAKGSCEPPVLMEITYCGVAPDDKPVLFLGKGITFNSGGINLRPKEKMDMNRACMAGAAACVGMMRAVAALSLPINVVLLVPLCENMPSGMSSKPGDVCTLLNGKSMAIRDLDKAGVVVLADPLLYGQTSTKPRLIVDVATIGRAIDYALGTGASGIFSNSNYIWKQFQRAGSLTGDRMWRMPLWDYYRKQVTDELGYDISNDGRGLAEGCLAAAVLHTLVPCCDWAHINTSGTGMLNETNLLSYMPKGTMSGRPTRTLVQFLYQLACPENK